jgi:purine-binding chemotaxis protein CheW
MTAAEGLHVVFQVGDAEYALPATDVQQMESFTGATPVPGARPWVSGLMQIRGRVVPVVDLRARFGLPPSPPTLDSRVVVVDRGGRVVGLLVDRAREVTRILPDQLQSAPEVLAHASQGFVKAVARDAGGKRLLMLIDFAKVVGEEHEHGG